MRPRCKNATTAESLACDLDVKMQDLTDDQHSIEEQWTAFRDTAQDCP